jgi:hypothetical protein
MMLDTRPPRTGPASRPPLVLPATVNPFGFLCENVFRGGAFAVLLKPARFGPDALGLHAARLLRRVIPPWTLCLLFVELEYDRDAVIMDGPGTRPGRGSRRTWRSYLGLDRGRSTPPTTCRRPSGSTRSAAGAGEDPCATRSSRAYDAGRGARLHRVVLPNGAASAERFYVPDAGARPRRPARSAGRRPPGSSTTTSCTSGGPWSATCSCPPGAPVRHRRHVHGVRERRLPGRHRDPAGVRPGRRRGGRLLQRPGPSAPPPTTSASRSPPWSSSRPTRRCSRRGTPPGSSPRRRAWPGCTASRSRTADNSTVFGGALVAFVDEDDHTRDLVLSRFYVSPRAQQPKLSTSQVGFEWRVKLL